MMEEVSGGKTKQISSKPQEPLLAALLGTMTPDYFLSTIYRVKPVVIRSKQAALKAITRDFLFDLDTRSLVENTASDQVNVWMRDKTSGRLQSFRTDSHEVALACHASGAALYMRSSQEMQDNVIPRMNRDLGINAAGFYADSATRGEIELFVTPAGHTTDWHFDFQENFNIQVSGCKRWTFKRGLQSPVRGYSPHFSASGNLEDQLKLHKLSRWENSNDEEFSLTLKPGHVMYHPAGILHKVECLEGGLSVGISIKAASNLDILSSTIRERLLGYEGLRSHFRADSFPDALAEAKRNLEILRVVVAELTPEDLVCSNMIRNKAVINTMLDTPMNLLPKSIRRVHKSKSAVLIDLSLDIPEAEQTLYREKLEDESADFTVHVHPCMEDGTESLMHVNLVVPSHKQKAVLRNFMKSPGPFELVRSDEVRRLFSWLVEVGAAKV